jgi:hypothetical protein
MLQDFDLVRGTSAHDVCTRCLALLPPPQCLSFGTLLRPCQRPRQLEAELLQGHALRLLCLNKVIQLRLV